MGFGALSHLPNYYLKHKVRKEIIKRYDDIYDNTIHAIAGEVQITTHKIGNALGLSSKGKDFDEKVSPTELNEENHAAYKFFQEKSQVALSKLVKGRPLNTEENKKLFMRAFVLFIQKCFLLPTSPANVTPRALPTIFDIENTRTRNWALHVHNFLLEEVKKAKLQNTKSTNGCCYAMLIIYFHETPFGKDAKKPETQPPWIKYWTVGTLWKRLKEEKKRLKEEKRHAVVKYEESSSSDESYSESESDSEQTRSDELIQRQQKTKPNPARGERRSKQKHEMNANEEMLQQNEEPTLAKAVKGIKKRKQQEKESRDSKKAKKPNEDVPIGSSENEQNAILLGSAIVSLGRDDSGNLIVDGPPITESQPSIHPVPEPSQQPATQEEQPL
ncbi:hypothetical protein PIB30_034740 [Stylosanthes scabra]|uniref:Uncharacterized protein n=1 Tax=Stylosanthes scabra TaxID=79078 RepID=A0ABU6XC21_9FABA|nr:hypothetical protein [Stylosanthes scabra]